MKKQLIITIAAGAAVLAYFVIRKKYLTPADARPEPGTNDIHRKHHLTDAFANAKKHVMSADKI